MHHRHALATLQLVAVRKRAYVLRLCALSTDGCRVPAYAIVNAVQFCIWKITFRSCIFRLLWTMLLTEQEGIVFIWYSFCSILLKTVYYGMYIPFLDVYTQQLYFNIHQENNKRVFWIYFCYIFNCLWGCKMSIYLYIILYWQCSWNIVWV